MLPFPVFLCLINLNVDLIFSFGSHKHIRRDVSLSFHAFDQVNFRVRFTNYWREDEGKILNGEEEELSGMVMEVEWLEV